MKLRILIYLLSTLFFLTACEKKETQVQESEETQLLAIDTLTIPNSTQGLKPSLRLTPKAQEAVKNWSLYQNISKRLDSLQGVSLGTLKNQLATLIATFDGQGEAAEEIVDLTPDNLETPAINARLLTVETKLKIVNNYAQKGDPNPEEIALTIVDLKNAFQNLNLQINEKFSLTVEEILKQLDQEITDPADSIEQEKPIPKGKPPVKIFKTNQ
ncbi:hypothetical protein ACFO3O_06535 [Dokdonia ponticola]|uniref:Lipoprotein n=1 Tax=Dokdonia ponticola TaxID=2041041 RepID=A0ABV9HW59_9FLAO